MPANTFTAEVQPVATAAASGANASTPLEPSAAVGLSQLGQLTAAHPADTNNNWPRSSVIYQVYPRSFRDLNGDGVGDLQGITAELEQVAALGVDAIWLSPFFKSPQRDAGYDVSDYCDIDPLFGTLDDFDQLMSKARQERLRVIVDLVPNHCSSEHELFKLALAAAPGTPERDMFIFRDGRGENGELPPNNWQSHFGGPAWTRTANPDGSAGQWYLHLFDSSQPDFNWDNPAVHAEFERILRFWLDRGVDGFRVDVAHALVKAPGLPDWNGRADGGSSDGYPGEAAPMFGQPALHDVYRQWRKVLNEYGPDRILCAEANVDPLSRMAHWVRPDEMHQAFNFPFLNAGFSADSLRSVIESSFAAFDAVGAPSTWVLSNHDVVRHATRLAFDTALNRDGDGVGPDDPQPNLPLGRKRAAAASLFMLGLPGAVYLYQGEELGLPDHTQLPADKRQDPTFARTNGERLGRDGCRVPLPWRAGQATFGFSGGGLEGDGGIGSGSQTWLPQPESWAEFARDNQLNDPASHLNLYISALALRKELALGTGNLAWSEDLSKDGVLAFVNGSLLVMINTGSGSVEPPAGRVLLRSNPTTSVTNRAETDAAQPLNSGESIWLQL